MQKKNNSDKCRKKNSDKCRKKNSDKYGGKYIPDQSNPLC